MNELEKNKQIESLLEEAAEQVQPNLVFKAELEEKLRKVHKPRKTIAWNFNKWMPTLSSITVLGALIVFMIWIFQSIEPQNGAATSTEFVCPVTLPNGSVPPGITPEEDPFSYGNGKLWTSLWPQGKIVMEEHNLEADGSYSMKWGYVRGVEGALTIEGRRLDAEAEPLRAFINDGYGESGLQILALIFPTTGCWEVTAHVDDASLTFVTDVVYVESTPEAILEPQVIITPQLNISSPQGTYVWRGTTLQLNIDLPDAPAEMTIYQAQPDTPATVDDLRTLAQTFGMSGEVYATPGNLPGTTGYLMVDGNRQLFARSKNIFHYIPNHSAYLQNPFFEKNEDAVTLIAEFMQTYGFGSNYTVKYAETYNGYYALPLDLNGYPLLYGYGVSSGYLFRFTEEGLVGVESSLVGYEALDTVSIISAEEAWQKILSSDGLGMQESMFTGSTGDIQSWVRSYPLDETVTIFGYVGSTGVSVDGKPPLVTLDGAPMTGNIESIPANLKSTFAEVSGRFIEEDGLRIFSMDSWKPYEGNEESIQGTLTREGAVVSITTTTGSVLLVPDAPNDLTFPVESVFLTGITRGDVFEWKFMDNRQFSGGGGGGGGGGFYKLNLSGTPVSFPTSQAVPLPQPEFEPQTFEALPGIVTTTIYVEEDGSQRAEYTFMSNENETETPYLILEGDGLEELQKFNNLPVLIWGRTVRISDAGLTIASVDRFEIPYPELKMQVYTGKTEVLMDNGQRFLLFTTEDGQAFAIMYPGGFITDDIGLPHNELIFVEGLAIPNESYGGYPALRIFGTGMATDPVTGERIEFTSTSSEPQVIPDNPAAPNTTISATLEQVELVYYTPDPRFFTPEQLPQPQYIQPVWRFFGHYADGSAFEIFVQALTQEFLLPETEFGIPPG